MHGCACVCSCVCWKESLRVKENYRMAIGNCGNSLRRMYIAFCLNDDSCLYMLI